MSYTQSMLTRGQKGKCYYCGANEACTRDHVIPRSKGGKYTVYACKVCQSTKANLMPLEWIEYLKKSPMYNKDAIARIERAVMPLLDIPRAVLISAKTEKYVASDILRKLVLHIENSGHGNILDEMPKEIFRMYEIQLISIIHTEIKNLNQAGSGNQ